MSGGTLMVWLRVCSASIGVPAAMRPITGTATGRLPSSSEPPPPLLRTLPRVPSMTLGVKPRRPLPLPLAESSGSLITSMARARLGRRRMKPRSSKAVIRRWIPDFDPKSSAPFISSKEGGTPDSFKRSLMNRSSSYCLRVSISTNPQFCHPEADGAVRFQDSRFQDSRFQDSRFQDDRFQDARLQEARFKDVRPQDRHSRAPPLETNHERTLYVPYVFRNHLISRQQSRFGTNVPRAACGQSGSRRMSQAAPVAA